MLNGDFDHLSYTEVQLKQLLRENSINLQENDQGVKVKLGSIFNEVDSDQEVHGDDAETLNDKKLSGNEITLFLTKAREYLNELNFSKLTEIFNREESEKAEEEALFKGQFENLEYGHEELAALLRHAGITGTDELFDKIQNRVGTKFDSDGDNTILSKEEIADFLLMAKEILPKKDFSKLATIIEQMKLAADNKNVETVGDNVIETFSYPAVDGKLSEAAKALIVEYGLPVDQVENGKFDSLDIRVENGVKTAVLSSSKHSYVFEKRHTPDGFEPSDISRSIKYENGVMKLDGVNLDKIDIRQDGDKSHKLVFSQSSLGRVYNTSGHPVHLENAGPPKPSNNTTSATYDQSYLEYFTTTNSDTYKINYYEAKQHHTPGLWLAGISRNHSGDQCIDGTCDNLVGTSFKTYHQSEGNLWYSHHKKSVEMELGPGTYMQKGYDDTRTIVLHHKGIPGAIYYGKKQTGSLERILSRATYSTVIGNDNFVISRDGINIGGEENYKFQLHEYACSTKVDKGRTFPDYAYINGGDFCAPTFYNSRMTIERNLKTNQPITNQYQQGFDDIINSIENGEEKRFSLVSNNNSNDTPDGINFLTNVCKLNSNKIQDLANAGFTEMHITRNDGDNTFNIKFTNTAYGLDLVTSLESLTQYVENMNIHMSMGTLKLDNVKGELNITDPSKLNGLNLGSVMLSLNIAPPSNKISKNMNITVNEKEDYRVEINNLTYGASSNEDDAEIPIIVTTVDEHLKKTTKTHKKDNFVLRCGNKNKENFDPLRQ